MNFRILSVFALAFVLIACGQQQSAKPEEEKSFGGQLGDSYKGMLNEAGQGVEGLNEQMQRTDQRVRDR